MMHRLISLLFSMIFLCPVVMANEEINLTLEPGEPKTCSLESYGYATLQLVVTDGRPRVVVSLENITTSQAMLLFKEPMDENSLKKSVKNISPKITFIKSYPGSKGQRRVAGCQYLNRAVVMLTPEEKTEFVFDTGSGNTATLRLPIYLAKYNANKLNKKGPYNIDYEILNEDVINFVLTIKSWTEDDPDYVSARNAVEEYVKSVENASFCRHPKHKPSLSQQQKPYVDRRDSLANAIRDILKNHPEYYSTDKSHIKYSELLTRLAETDLNAKVTDCGKHHGKSVSPNPGGHKCGYCSLSQQQVYNQLDDLYQQMRAGKISKAAAVKKAQDLKVCIDKNNKRKKDPGFTDKISKFYSRIISY